MKIPSLICFDVGARNGLKDLLKISENISLYSFEPNIEKDDLLGREAKYSSCRIINKGLYKESGIFDFYTTSNPSMSSMLQPDEELLQEYFGEITAFKKWGRELKITGTKKISTTTIDALVEEEKIGQIDYLKLDTQGTELEILKGAANCLKEKRILVLKTEFSFIRLYKGQAVFSEIDNYLSSFGYKLINCDFDYGIASPFNDEGEKPKWGIGGDAYYCIDPMVIDNKDKLYNAALVLGALGFLSNATAIFKSLNIDKYQQDVFYKKVKVANKKRMLKYLLPPFVINLYKNIFKS